jgi:hypothetical protein
MPFTASWGTLLDALDDLPDGATLITPLSHNRFRIIDIQEHRVIIQFDETGEKRPLQRDQFETLYRRMQDAHDGFELDRLPPDADPYPAVLSLHPRFEVNEEAGVSPGITIFDHSSSIESLHHSTRPVSYPQIELLE